MREPRSRLISLACCVYALVAAAGLYISVLGQMTKPDSLQRIEETEKQPVQLEQAERTMVQAQQQSPGNAILREFYRGWLLESDYEDLAEFTTPSFEGDSFERRLEAYNRTVADVDEIYEDAVFALFLLSSGSMILVLFMLWSPGYLVSVLLASYPVVWVFSCAVLGVNHDPVFAFWAPFPALGATIFVLQLIYAFRFGRPEHRTVEGLPGLMVYRQGLVKTNLGLFMFLCAMLMVSGTLSGPVRSLRALRGLALFGEGGIVLIGFVVGALLIVLGVRDMNSEPQVQVDSTAS